MKTLILYDKPENIALAAQEIGLGNPVAFPTETVYGLGANIFNIEGIYKIFQVKERPLFDPLIAHCLIEKGNILEQLKKIGIVDTELISPSTALKIEKLGSAFWPGPLTLVLPKSSKVSDLVTSGLQTVAVRSPNHPVSRKLLEKVGAPIVAPSANKFGKISPTTANDVFSDLNGQISIILDGGRSEGGIESTIVLPDLDGQVVLLRPGIISVEELESVLGEKILTHHQLEQRLSPGRIKTHYSPQKKLLLSEKEFVNLEANDWQLIINSLSEFNTVGILSLRTDEKMLGTLFREKTNRTAVIKTLSKTNNEFEMAKFLFGSLRVLDLSPAEIIIAEIPNERGGIKFGLADRLLKAGGSQILIRDLLRQTAHLQELPTNDHPGPQQKLQNQHQ